MKNTTLFSIALVVVGMMLLVTAASAQTGSVSRGGLLYDNWRKVVDAEAPGNDHPLWATQSTNTRSGADTWRCKECHGWDYLGKDGAYGSGSHMTGFVGVYEAAQTKSVDELAAALKGATNPDHDFSSVLDDVAIADLATFLKEGTIDVRQYVDYDTKATRNANENHGKELYGSACAACHGADGAQINFNDDAEPEYIGDIAAGNPQEFLHKVRAGQPGTPMPSGIELGWSMQDVVDVLAHAQTLPTGEEMALTLPETGGNRLPVTSLALVLSGLLTMGLGLAMLAVQLQRRARLWAGQD